MVPDERNSAERDSTSQNFLDYVEYGKHRLGIQRKSIDDDENEVYQMAFETCNNDAFAPSNLT